MKKFFNYLLILLLCFVLVGCNTTTEQLTTTTTETLTINQFDYVTESVFVQTGDYSMPGILTMPLATGPVPAIIFIHGSGPADMDESVGALKMFQDLAIHLAEEGIASIRYNKRTYEYADELADDYDFTIYDESINDVLSAYQILMSDSRIDNDQIYLIGHSQGGTIAPIVMNIEPNIVGAIIMAGSTENILDILADQFLRYYGQEYLNEYLPYIETAKSLTEVLQGEEAYSYFGAYEAYWVNYNSINFTQELLNASVDHPLLIMQGGTDIQITLSNFETYQTLLGANELCVFKYYEELNHCFVNGVGETLATAYIVSKEIPDEVLDDICAFILG
ncbi:MAG: alpha/beta hydrolase [Firmicutes bacterium]|nr:alpha/beta hydrolase [Bacillota bacterium]